MKRHFALTFALVCCLTGLGAATLERLSLDDMIGKSTSIIRGKVTGSWAAFSGPVIYTHYTIQVAERFKGSSSASVEVVVPGGVANNLRQSFAGAPELHNGEAYVLFLWAGKDNITQVIGWTQGMFALSADSQSDPTATRTATTERMFDRSGQQVRDETLVMRLSDLRTRINASLGGTKGR